MTPPADMPSQSGSGAQARRVADGARTRILDAAFADIYEHGFQGLRIDGLLEKVELTKGAFYHHFPSKQALGLAVIDEVLAPMADLIWGRHLEQYDDPIAGIEASVSFAIGMLGERCTTLGCPINNLAQEMSGLDDAFRERLDHVFRGIIGSIAAALRRGQSVGRIRSDIDADACATFILASVEGAIGLAKSARCDGLLEVALGEAKRYLASLRA